MQPAVTLPPSPSESISVVTLIVMCSFCVASLSCDRNLNFLSVGDVDAGSTAQTIFNVTCGEWAVHPAAERSAAAGLQCMQGAG